MGSELPQPLTLERIEAFRRGEEAIRHPLVGVLQQNAPRIHSLAAHYKTIQGNKLGEAYLDASMGSLIPAIDSVGDFPLGSLDIVAVWSKAMELFPSLYQRYRLAHMIVSTYVTRGIGKPQWGGFPRRYFETKVFPEDLGQDREGLLFIKDRLWNLVESLRALPVDEEDSFTGFLNETKENFNTAIQPIYHWLYHFGVEEERLERK